MPTVSAAAFERSITRPWAYGPRSLMRTTTDWPVRSLVTRTLDRTAASLQSRCAVNKDELGRPQTTAHEIVQDRPPGCLALAAHVLDREEHLLPILAHAQHHEKRDRGRLAVEPHPHDGAVEDEADDRLGRQVAPGPGVPI